MMKLSFVKINEAVKLPLKMISTKNYMVLTTSFTNSKTAANCSSLVK
jgi:hypothetical protein